MEVKDGNKLIAVWMGAIDETGYFQASTIGKTKVPTGRLWMSDRFPSNMHLCNESDLQYHTSWDWLMPVVEKIEGMGHSTNIDSDVREPVNDKYYCGILYKNTLGSRITDAYSRTSKIESVWLAVVQFIQWHLTQNK